VPAPNLGLLLIALMVLIVIGTGVWFFIRSAVRSGAEGSERRKEKADQRREMHRWEASQRNETD
jgi:flagellar basal body-associated protein FliL